VITIFHIYYGQRHMLPLHSKAWSSHRAVVDYCIIDDCSPIPIRRPIHPRLKIYRVKEDIPWNIAGARNLGFHVAETEWVMGADVDHVVTAEALDEIMRLDMSNPNVAYLFKRRTEQGRVGCDAIINILMNKRKFFEIGGYDEEFSGGYGREETFFSRCLRSRGMQIIKSEIVLAWYPREGGTRGVGRSRSRNTVIFEDKLRSLNEGTYRNGPILRFPWERWKTGAP
jgi:hypothetical protein